MVREITFIHYFFVRILNEREMNVKKREAKHKQEEFDNIKNAEEMAALQKQTWEEVYNDNCINSHIVDTHLGSRI